MAEGGDNVGLHIEEGGGVAEAEDGDRVQRHMEEVEKRRMGEVVEPKHNLKQRVKMQGEDLPGEGGL